MTSMHVYDETEEKTSLRALNFHTPSKDLHCEDILHRLGNVQGLLQHHELG